MLTGFSTSPSLARCPNRAVELIIVSLGGQPAANFSQTIHTPLHSPSYSAACGLSHPKQQMGRAAAEPGWEQAVRGLFPLGFNLPPELEGTLRSAPARDAPVAWGRGEDCAGVKRGRESCTVAPGAGSDRRAVEGAAFPSRELIQIKSGSFRGQ